MKASISNFKSTPRKTRLVTDLVKGKTIDEALTVLKFLNKRAALPIAKLIASAVANAEKQGEDTRLLIIENITVDKGLVRTSFMPRAFGRASPINHRMSHVRVVLGKRGTKATKRASKKQSAAKK